MKKFVTWQRERRLREMSGCPSDRFHFDRNNSVGRDYEKDLLDLSKLATTKYHNEFFRFLESLADQNNDQELREAVRRVQDGTTSSRWGGNDDKPEVMAPTADKGSSPEE
jgi:hypothetical protein